MLTYFSVDAEICFLDINSIKTYNPKVVIAMGLTSYHPEQRS